MIRGTQQPTILSASLARSIWHPRRARDEEVRLLVQAGAGVRATARRFYISPALVCAIAKKDPA